jgi:hypothetical protein
MNVLSILCQRCGAPLQIADESVRFVTCAHCGTPLEIVREATQAHSRILQQIHAATAENTKTLKVIELQNDLELLDREWAATKEHLCGRNPKTGELNDGPSTGCMPLGVLLAVGGLTLIVTLLRSSQPFLTVFLLGILGIAGIIGGAFMVRVGWKEDQSFHNRQQRYFQMRAQLIQRIKAAKNLAS